MSHTGTPRKSSLNKESEVAKKIRVFQNGNKYFQGCDTYLNPKHYPTPNTFMDHLTYLIPKKGGKSKGCIRRLYTKSGRRILAFSQINDGGIIVAAAGHEDFQQDSYETIQHKTPRKGHRMARNNDFVPNKNSKYDDIKPRFHETGEPGIRVNILKNGEPLIPAVLVLLTHKRRGDLHCCTEDISKKMYEESKYPVGHIYDLGGNKINSPEEFHPGEFYVAVPPSQPFKPVDYGCRVQGLKNFIVNPYYGTGFPRSSYLWQDIHRSSRPTTWTSKHHNPIPPISKPSPNQSVASHPETSLRRRKIQNHHDAQRQHKAPEKKVRQVDYDQDNSNVFRAKNQNKTTKGAKEVKDTKDTKTDLPIDQVKAEEVEEDYYNDKDDRRSSKGTAYTKEKSNHDLNPYKVLDPIKKDNRSSTPVRGDDHRDRHDHDDDDDDDEEMRRKEDEAATKIQASFRGHQARQEIANKQKEEEARQTKQDTRQQEQTKNTATDKENEAAAKIQAGFRGYQTRQELKAKGHKVRPPISSQGDAGEAPKVTKEEEDAAATKIQASVRGYQARKEIKALKEEKKKNEAATLIQANFKGYKTRQEIKEKKAADTAEKSGETTNESTKKETTPKEKTPKETDEKKQLTEDEAATKIQASFKGYQTRQKIKEEQGQKS